MIEPMYAILDVKTEAFTPPFVCHNDSHAVRMFTDACASPKTQYNNHPEDFMLYHLGKYNDNSGELLSLDKPKFVIGAVAVTKGLFEKTAETPQQQGA